MGEEEKEEILGPYKRSKTVEIVLCPERVKQLWVISPLFFATAILGLL